MATDKEQPIGIGQGDQPLGRGHQWDQAGRCTLCGAYRDFNSGSWDCPAAWRDADFPTLVAEELQRVRQHGHVYASAHEAYGVLADEVAQFFDEVRKKHRDCGAILRELVQVAAVAQKAAETLCLKAENGSER